MKISYTALVYSKNLRKDKTFPITIRISYKGKYANLETGLSACKTELKDYKGEGKKLFKIKNAYLTERCNEKISKYNELIRKVELPENSHILPYDFTVKDIKELLVRGTVRPKSLDFMEEFQAFLDKKKDNISIGAYQTTYNHLQAFAGATLLVDNITPNKLTDFENYLKNKANKWGKNMGSRGLNLYMNAIRTVYNWVMDEYEYKGYSFRYPFRKYKIPSAKYDATTALTKQQLRAIIETPLTGIRANRARDLFVISLLSVGTNAKDFYLLERISKRLEYKRSKTKGKRKDEAFISIKIEPELKPYLAKYWGNSSSPLPQLYKTPSILNATLREGLISTVKQVNNKLGNDFLPSFDYYDARRSVASVMRNDLGISKDDVAKCLNHIGVTNRTTDIYIEQDFSIIDKCNRLFIDWLFSD